MAGLACHVADMYADKNDKYNLKLSGLGFKIASSVVNCCWK